MPERQADEALIRAALDLPAGTDVQMRPLGGGLNGRSFRVEWADRRWVAKCVGDVAGALIGVDTERELLERLAAAGVSPRPVAADRARGILVTEFIADARPLTPAEAREPGMIRRLAALLGKLHHVEARLPEFVPARYAERYIAALGGRERLGEPAAALAAELDALARFYTARFPAAVLCHNDLVAANVLAGAKLRLIDFEYAAQGAPVLDLASLAAMNGYGEEEERLLLSAYESPVREPFSPAEFAKVRRLVALLAHFWARAWSGRNATAVDRFLAPAAPMDE